MEELKNKKVFLLDMDGTIYLGDELIDGAKDFLNKIKEEGKSYIFLTNNSSRDRGSYVDKLRGMDIKAEEEEVYTSGLATITYLKDKKAGAKIYLLGTEELEREFEEAGFQLVRERNVEVDYVVLGFDTTLTYEKLWAACEYISQGVEYIATHPDFNCPLPDDKFMPDAGAMAALIEASTGETPYVVGKPNKGVIDSIASEYGIDKDDMIMIGDRLYTDIKTGINAGISTAVVFSGETKEEDYKQSDTKADYAFKSVKDMIELI